MPSYAIKGTRRVLKGDYTEVGNFAKISNGVASGFKVGTLLQTPDIIDTSSNTWERVIKITTGDVSSNQSIWGTIPDYQSILLRLYDGKLHFWVSSNGTSWNIASDATSSLTLLGVKDYYIKTSFNGSQYLVDVSTNGVDYTNYITVASSTNTVAGKISIGGQGVSETSFDTPFLGSVDLNETYIKVGDETVWSGDRYSGIGSWNNDNNVSGFTASNYLKLPKSFAPANNPWEVSIPFITGAFNARQRIFNSTTDYVGVMLVIEPAGTFTLALSSGNTSWDIGAPVSTKTISANVMYTAKISFTGTQYKLDIYNHNRGTWENYITVDNSSPVSANTYVIGRSENDSFPQPLSGSIDLNNSYIKINDELWWTGTKRVPENKAYILQTKDTKYYKDIVTTKYWKEVTTSGRELDYECYYESGNKLYFYAKAPLTIGATTYINTAGVKVMATASSQLKAEPNGYKWQAISGDRYYTGTKADYAGVGNYACKRHTAGDLYKNTTTTKVVEGTPEDYTYTTTETTTVEVTKYDDYDRVEAGNMRSYFLSTKGAWVPVYENYSLPTMTSRTAPEGTVSTNISNGEYTIDAYNFFFNRNWHFEAEGREGSRYNRYTFARPLKSDTYTISFGGKLQGQDSNSGTLSVWYEDGTKETLITYTLSTSSQTFSKTFTATKPIRTISIDMTVSRRDNKNDVTTFYGLNIVSNTGQLQRFKGYQPASGGN